MPGNSLVPSLITSYLVFPCLHVCLWRNVFATVVAMPKASIYENCDLRLGPHEIRVTGKLLVSTPAGQTSLPQQAREFLLSRLISRAADTRHKLPASQPAKRRKFFPGITRP